MVRRALGLGGLVLLPLAAGAGFVLGGPAASASAALAVVLILMNFAAHGLSLAWAAGISVTAVHAVALGGFAARMVIVVGALFTLSRAPFFVPMAFGLAVVGATLTLLVYEARLFLGRPGSGLEIPPDAVAVEAGRRLRAREALR